MPSTAGDSKNRHLPRARGNGRLDLPGFSPRRDASLGNQSRQPLSAAAPAQQELTV